MPNLLSFVIVFELLHEADRNTVLLWSLEWVDSVTEVLSDDSVLIDTSVNNCLSNNLRPLL